MKRDSDDQYSPKETQQRLRTVLRGAFAGPPTHLKDIPTREGKSRGATKRRGRKSKAA